MPPSEPSTAMIRTLLASALALPFLFACGGGMADGGNGGSTAGGMSRAPAEEDAAGWRRRLATAVQAPWEGRFRSAWEGEAPQEGRFVRLASDRFQVRLRTALTRHEPDGAVTEQDIQVEIGCDGEELRILLPAVLGAGPTLATLPASRLGALEEVDPQGQASQFRPDALSPWHLLQRTLDYGRPVSSGVVEERLQLELAVPAGTLARFAKEEDVAALLRLDEEGRPAMLVLQASGRRLQVDFLEVAPADPAAAGSLRIEAPAGATALPLGGLVDADLEAANAVDLDQLGY